MDRFQDTKTWEYEKGEVLALIVESLDTEYGELLYEAHLEVNGETVLWRDGNESFEMALRAIESGLGSRINLRKSKPTKTFFVPDSVAS